MKAPAAALKRRGDKSCEKKIIIACDLTFDTDFHPAKILLFDPYYVLVSSITKYDLQQ